MVISNGCYLDFYNISVNLSSTNYILNGMGATQDGQLKSTLQADGTTTGTAGSFTINGTVTLNATSDIGGTSPAQTMTLAGTVTGPGGLVKNGSSGTLVLANTNTYAGGTTVSSGLVKAQVAGSLGSGVVVVTNGAVLELDNPAAMSSSASLFVLGTTNLVNLNYSGAQIVNTLYINGAPCAAGVWGTLGSSAANQSATFSGSGTLSVSVTGAPLISNQPTNIIYQVAAGNLVLAWPGDHLGWYAQSNGVSLANSNAWFDLAGSQLVTNLTLPINQAVPQVFYRLRHP